MSLPRYPAYKDSGVAWLGQIPTHWDLNRLKHRCNVFPSNVDKKTNEGEAWVRLCNYTDVYYSDCIRPDMTFMEATASDEQVCKFTLRAGDTIFTKDSETADDIGVAALVPMDIPGVVCGYHLSIARPHAQAHAHGAYVKRLFDAHYTKAQFAVLANGLTRVGLNQYAVDNVELPWPPLEEQVTITTFLDRETAKIDALIAEQETLLALLAEKRQATISHAVTKGLNPDAPMKDSGIPWLGDVPVHWEVTRCGRFVSVLSGFAFPSSGFEHEGTGTRLLRGVNISVSSLRWDDVVYWERTPDDGLDDYQLNVGDLVIGMDRPLIAAGMRVAKLKEEDVPCLLLQRVALLRTTSALDSDFLMSFLSSPMFVAHFSPETTGVSVPHISPEQISSFVIAVPPMDEQRRIVQLLNEEILRLDALTTQAERAVGLLKERRSALIAAAVTGQIDVRGVVSEAA